jgi:hypothetical protein
MIENLGSSTFVTAHPNPIYVTYRWYRDGATSHIVEAPLMTPLPRALPPRSRADCKVRIRTHDSGHYRLRLTLAQEAVGWFDDDDPAGVAEANVEVVPAS